MIFIGLSVVFCFDHKMVPYLENEENNNAGE